MVHCRGMTKNYETTVKSLLRRHGYSFVKCNGGFRLVELAIRGFTDEVVHPEFFRTLQGAIDRLCWLAGDEFSADYHATFAN
jgi:hypothetical protein